MSKQSIASGWPPSPAVDPPGQPRPEGGRRVVDHRVGDSASLDPGDGALAIVEDPLLSAQLSEDLPAAARASFVEAAAIVASRRREALIDLAAERDELEASALCSQLPFMLLENASDTSRALPLALAELAHWFEWSRGAWVLHLGCAARRLKVHVEELKRSLEHLERSGAAFITRWIRYDDGPDAPGYDHGLVLVLGERHALPRR